MKEYFVYILTNSSGTLYTGVTNNLERRLAEHKSGEVPGLASRYQMGRLVYFESTGRIESAIAREKEIKGWRREKKVDLIESLNPNWKDLSGE